MKGRGTFNVGAIGRVCSNLQEFFMGFYVNNGILFKMNMNRNLVNKLKIMFIFAHRAIRSKNGVPKANFRFFENKKAIVSIVIFLIYMICERTFVFTCS